MPEAPSSDPPRGARASGAPEPGGQAGEGPAVEAAGRGAATRDDAKGKQAGLGWGRPQGRRPAPRPERAGATRRQRASRGLPRRGRRPAWEPEQWIDEGEVRGEARRARSDRGRDAAPAERRPPAAGHPRRTARSTTRPCARPSAPARLDQDRGAPAGRQPGLRTGALRGGPPHPAAPGRVGAHRGVRARAARPDLLPTGSVEAGGRRARGVPAAHRQHRAAPRPGRLLPRPRAPRPRGRAVGGPAGRVAQRRRSWRRAASSMPARWPTRAGWPTPSPCSRRPSRRRSGPRSTTSAWRTRWPTCTSGPATCPQARELFAVVAAADPELGDVAARLRALR